MEVVYNIYDNDLQNASGKYRTHDYDFKEYFWKVEKNNIFYKKKSREEEKELTEEIEAT